MSQDVLLEPYITEKTTRLMEEGQYVFLVRMDADKPTIKQAVKKRYPGAIVTDVRTMIIPGKKRQQFTRRGLVEGRTSAFKKAIISTDPEGEPIDFFEAI